MRRLIEKLKKFFLNIKDRSYYFLCRIYLCIELILKKKFNEAVIIPYYSIGDFSYGMSFASKDLLKCKRITLYLFRKSLPLLELYDNRGVSLKIFENDSWRAYSMNQLFMRKHYILFLRNFNVFIPYPYYFQGESYLGKSCHDILRQYIFGISNDIRPRFPKIPEASGSLLDKYGLKTRNIVIINPYSDSLPFFPKDFYSFIVSDLKERGYIVYTNAIKNQEVLQGTERLNCSIAEFASICNKVPYVISIRSGIVDISISSKTKFLVFYPELNDPLYRKFSTFYSLKSWNTDNVTEFVYKDYKSSVDYYLNFIGK